jgi:pimeloyl-ACP methyl ester carboxylesterase
MHPNVRTAVAAVLVGITLGLAGCAPRPAGEEAQKKPQEAAGTVYGSAGKIYVDDGGAGGMPVVFVHSFSGSSAHWGEALAHLRTTRRALALDLRGHGQSAAPAPASGGYAADSLASDILAVADQLGLGRFVLVGHSMGGTASAAFAGAHPERVAGLVLVGTPGPSPPAMAQQVLARMEANYDSTSQGYWDRLLEGATPETRTRIKSEMASIPKEAGLEIIRAIFAYDPMPAIRAYPGPVLVIDTQGGDSPTSIHRLLPKLPHRVIAGTSHWPQLDRPQEFDAVLDEFLSGIGVDTAAAAPTDTL